ncbi:tyrosinase [Dendrothele bispora CBS 962.96]|uniref:Tyrosinase n=1 Tax=Dendrothele bispora (strain CBS 962.96) TaxID=1314807 RepID=A0A4S8M8C5_DENBC|nr:tyrosinase [Dendrothele bispora CBS 962.96]
MLLSSLLGFWLPVVSFGAPVQECRRLFERREWRTFSNEEKIAYISSVKCLTAHHHERLSYTSSGILMPGSRSIYDDFALTHDMLEDFAHENAYFLPWHRYFTYLFELALRDRCNYEGAFPYWDWSLDLFDMKSSPVFDPDLTSGLGTNGDCISTDCFIHDGAFGDVTLAYPIPHHLRRNITFDDPATNRSLTDKLSAEHLFDIMRDTTGDFFTFQHRFSHVHNNLHFIIGGDMDSECPSKYPKEACDLTSFASNDPLFWLHHGQIDRIWSKWQSLHPDNFYAFQGYPLNTHNLSDSRYDPEASVSQKLDFDRLSTSVAVSQVFNHTAPPFCYVYVEH